MTEMARGPDPSLEPGAVDPTALRAATAWVQQWSRTLKTWRLYGAQNPTLEKFRVDLWAALEAWLEREGAFTLRFTTDSVTWHGRAVHQARAREDNLSLVFFRDGIHSITFSPGMERAELDAFLLAVIRASDRMNPGEEDLVTLLWDAELTHFDMNYFSAEASLDLDDDSPGSEPVGASAGEAGRLAWPAPGDSETPGPPESAQFPDRGSRDSLAEPSPTIATRSEDWPTRDPGAALEPEFDEMERLGESAVARFRSERERENATPRGTATLALLEAAFGAGLEPAERAELSPLIETLWSDALVRGAWDEAHEAVRLLLAARSDGGGECAWLAPLARPDSVVSGAVVQHLDRQGQAEVAAFLAIVPTVGDSGLDWFMHLLAESRQQRVRRPLARAIAGTATNATDRIARWLGDPRWYVVRNVVHILAGIGGDATLAPLASVLQHPDVRVRLEVLSALAKASPAEARPLLIRLLDSDDVRVLSGALHQLSGRRDPEVARLLLGRVSQEGFGDRPAPEQRVLLAALGATGDDSLLPALLQLLDPARKPAPAATPMLQGLAMCVARIGTAAATEALQAAQCSRWQATREAAALALAARGVR